MPSKSAFFTIIITAQRQKFGITKTRSISVFLMRNKNKMYSKNAKKTARSKHLLGNTFEQKAESV